MVNYLTKLKPSCLRISKLNIYVALLVQRTYYYRNVILGRYYSKYAFDMTKNENITT